MKEKFIQIPQALRKQIWLRCGGAGMGAAMLLMVLIYSTDWRFMVPCAVAAALCIASAALLYYRCIQGRYVEICGVCTEIERSGIRKRIKAIYLQTPEHTIRVVGIKPIPLLRSGYPSVRLAEPGALICRWQLHNARIQQRHNGTSVIRGPATMKAGR